MLLYEAPSVEWTAERVGESVGLRVADSRAVLIRLSRHHLIVAHRGGPQLAFSYVDGQPELDEAIRRVAALYVRQRATLLSLFDA